MLAEDNTVNQRLALAVLTKAGYTVEIVADGAQAVRAVEQNHYDLVLMDVQMPVMDGMEATRRIRALGTARAGVPIVAMTANAMSGARETYAEAGMNDFVAKPFDRAKLVETIERLTHASAAPEREEPDDSGDALPLFSEEPLVGLADAIPMSEIASMVTELLDTSATRLDLIVQLAAAGDWPKLASQAHDMVSTSGNFGLMRVSHTAREIEIGRAHV